MKNSNNEIVPNAQFPFGEPLKPVKQQDRSPKKVFILGVYASAVHAKWLSPQGEQLAKALAVASEPEIFWKGDNAAEIISKINVPKEAGSLEPADGEYNGPSGKALDELYLKPLGLTRSDVWLCDLVPHSLMNDDQRKAINNHYVQLQEKYNLPIASIPEDNNLSKLIDEARRNEILAELEESKAETIILLGDKPIEYFLHYVSDNKNKKLDDFGRDNYGSEVSVNINGKSYSVIPLVHMYHSSGMGNYSKDWKQRHDDWVEKKNRQNGS